MKTFRDSASTCVCSSPSFSALFSVPLLSPSRNPARNTEHFSPQASGLQALCRTARSVLYVSVGEELIRYSVDVAQSQAGTAEAP